MVGRKAVKVLAVSLGLITAHLFHHMSSYFCCTPLPGVRNVIKLFDDCVLNDNEYAFNMIKIDKV